MNRVRCSPAIGHDAAQIEALACRAGLNVDARAGLAKPHVRGWVARLPDSDDIVGFILCWELGDELEIQDLATAPEHRRLGVASTLLSEVIRAATLSGSRGLWLEVRMQNHAALALYEKHGFQRTATRKRYYRSPPDDALCLQLLLPVR